MNHHRHRTERGAALVIGLILLAVITLLAVVGMNIANSELRSATSEQLRLRAFNAAESGLEQRFQTFAVDAVTSSTPIVGPTVAVVSSATNVSTGAATDHFRVTTTYHGEGSMISRYSVNTFAGFHFSVESAGTSARSASVIHGAGAYLVNGTGDVRDYRPLPVGLPFVALP
jgi:Tfp pilus assembly protein PilX